MKSNMEVEGLGLLLDLRISMKKVRMLKILEIVQACNKTSWKKIDQRLFNFANWSSHPNPFNWNKSCACSTGIYNHWENAEKRGSY